MRGLRGSNSGNFCKNMFNGSKDIKGRVTYEGEGIIKSGVDCSETKSGGELPALQVLLRGSG